MPVDSHSHSGVCRVTAGSRITARGITRSWRSISLTLVRWLVTPASALNSPPAIVVGTLIWRTEGAAIGGTTPLFARTLSMSSTVRTSLARQSCTALAPSVIEPPPTVTIRSALAARACSAAAMTASRGVCGGIASKVAAQRAPRLLRIFSISSVSRLRVPLTIRNARLAPQTVHLLDHRLRGGTAENNLIHGAENDTSLVHGLSSPRHFGFVGSLEGRLAEEIQDVMPEDEAAGLPAPPPARCFMAAMRRPLCGASR